MSWREFQLRLIGFKRQQKEDWIRTREIAYSSWVGPHIKLEANLTKEKFMPLGVGNKNKVSNAGKEALRKAQLEYENFKNK